MTEERKTEEQLVQTSVNDKAEHVHMLKENSLNALQVAIFVVAAAAPLMCVAGASCSTYRLGGLPAPWAYLVAMVFLLCFSAGFTAMAMYIKNAGAFWVYIARGLGKRMGVASSIMAVFAYTTLNTGFYGFTAFFADELIIDLFGVNLPWEFWVVIVFLAVGFFGYRDINLAANVMLIALGAEVVILVLLSAAVLIKGGPEGLTVESLGGLNPSLWPAGIAALVVFGFGAFTGFESTAIYSEEVKDPAKSIPRATYGAVLFLGFFYSFSIWIATVAFGPDGVIAFALGDTFDDMFFVAGQDYLGRWAEITLRILVVTSSVACQIGFHNAISRYMFSLGRDHVLPRYLGHSHPRWHSPHKASLAASGVSLIVVAIFIIFRQDPYLRLFTWTYGPGVTGLLMTQALTVIAVVVWFWNNPRGHSLWRVRWLPIIGAFGMITASVMVFLNFDLLSGYLGWVNIFFVLPVVVVFIVGMIRGIWIKSHDVEAWQNLAEDREHGELVV